MAFKSDEEKFAFIREKLYTGVVSDALDRLGFREQVMRHDIRPLHSDFIVIGRARTLLWRDIYESKENPYEGLFNLVDSLKPGDVCVHNTDYSQRHCCWGELMSYAAKERGSTGTIMDRFTRDVKEIIRLGFPVFARGITTKDPGCGRSEVVDLDVAISCGDVTVHPGELVFGDCDGVVVLPREVEDEVLAKALEKAEGENLSRRQILKGKLLQQLWKEGAEM